MRRTERKNGGKGGRMDIEHGVMIEGLEARQMFAADLGVRFDDFQLPANMVPGDRFYAPIIVKNNGPMSALGNVTIQYYASINNTYDANDILMGSYQSGISLDASGVNSEGDFSDLAELPRNMEPGNYFLLIRIIPNNQVGDNNQSNNVAITNTTFNVSWRFGDFNGRNDVKLQLSDNDSNVEFRLLGPGSGTVTKNPDGSFSVTMADTGANTDVGIEATGGDALTTIKNFTAPGNLRYLDMRTANLTGTVSIGGTLGRIDTKNVIGVPNTGAAISITGVGVETTFKLGQVSNLSITSNSGIAELTLTGKWSDNDSMMDVISAPYLTALNVTGNFAAALRLSATSGPNGTPVLGGTNITGQAGTNSWWVNGKGGVINVGSTNVNFSASFAGNVTSFNTTNGDMRGDIASPKFNSVSIFNTINTGRIFAGATFGRDGRFGGTGDNADTFTFGQLLALNVGNKILRGLIAVGLVPNDGIIDNGDDYIKGGNGSKLGAVTVGRTTTPTTRFFAGKFNGAVSINGQTITPANDRRFVIYDTSLPVATLVTMIPTTGATSFQVRFRDNRLMNYSTIGDMDVRVVGPNGFDMFVTLAAPLPAVNGPQKTATFNFTAPGGAWDATDNGQYQIFIENNSVFDMVGNAVAGGLLGEFTIAV